jgi:hypothetical protein
MDNGWRNESVMASVSSWHQRGIEASKVMASMARRINGGVKYHRQLNNGMAGVAAVESYRRKLASAASVNQRK